MQKFAEYALDLAKQLGASYSDVRCIEQESQEIVTKDQTVARLAQGCAAGGALPQRSS
jgi:predicted Zn-dependent protease